MKILDNIFRKLEMSYYTRAFNKNVNDFIKGIKPGFNYYKEKEGPYIEIHYDKKEDVYTARKFDDKQEDKSECLFGKYEFRNYLTEEAFHEWRKLDITKDVINYSSIEKTSNKDNKKTNSTENIREYIKNNYKENQKTASDELER